MFGGLLVVSRRHVAFIFGNCFSVIISDLVIRVLVCLRFGTPLEPCEVAYYRFFVAAYSVIGRIDFRNLVVRVIVIFGLSLNSVDV
ncbi:MAG: hypothetical protein GF383_13315 [Candidatus Lokiarchaeota archaeon]|nr:hypothetical protein [Candidatus Lokiarchaeota archaeon]